MAESHSGVGATGVSIDSSDKGFSCPECSRQYKTKGGFQDHVRSCCPENLMPCPSCDMRFLTEYGIQLHHAKTHDESLVYEEYECDWCGDMFSRRECNVKESQDNVFCTTDCKNEWGSVYQSGKHSATWEGGHVTRYGDNWVPKKRQTLERDNYSCVICGCGKEELGRNPDVHHVKPVSEFENPSDAHTLENLVTLCRKHHVRWEGLYLRPDTRGKE